MANVADQIGRLIRVNTPVSPELRPLITDINRALREMDRRRSTTTPDVVNDESARPSADLNEGRMIYVRGSTQEFQFSDGSVWNSIFTGGGGGTAPVNATFICVTNDSTLTNERSLAVTAPITKSDAGANSAITIALDATALGGTPNLTLGTANTPGSDTTFIRTDDTILTFDSSTPAVLATAGSAGSGNIAARSNHVHEFPTALQSDSNSTTLILTDSGVDAQTLTFSGNSPRIEWNDTGLSLGEASSTTRNRIAMGRSIEPDIMLALFGSIASQGSGVSLLVENTSAGDTLTGVIAQTQGLDTSGSGTGNTFQGMMVQHIIRSPSSTITDLMGVADRISVDAAANSSSNTTNRYGYKFEANPDPAAAEDSGTISNTYAHYVDDISFGTTRWAFYSEADPIRIGDHAEFLGISTPANPASGSRRLFADSGNSDHISIRTSSGSTVDLEAAAGGGLPHQIFLDFGTRTVAYA